MATMLTDALHDYNLRQFPNIDPPEFTATYEGSVGQNSYIYVATYVTINGETTPSQEVKVENCDVLSDLDKVTLVARNIPAAARTIKYYRKVGEVYKYIGTSVKSINSLVDNGIVPTDEQPPTVNTSGSKDYQFIAYRPDRPLQRLELIDQQAIFHNRVKSLGDTTFSNGDIVSGLSLITVDFDAHKFKVGSGVVYFDGAFINVPESEIFTLSGSGKETIGLKVSTNIVTYEDDPKLRNIDDGSPIDFYNLPGADRIVAEVEWVVNDNSALVIHEFDNGIQKIRPLPMERTVLMRSLAKRTKDTIGDCVIEPFQAKIVANTESNNKLDVYLGRGSAYVDGYEVTIPSGGRRITFNKAREYASENAVKALTYQSSGGYFVSSNGPFNVNGKVLKFKFGKGMEYSVTFTGTLTAPQICEAIRAAIPWYIDSSYICEPVGPTPQGSDTRQFMFAAPKGKSLHILNVENDCYSAIGIVAAEYKCSGTRIYKLRRTNIKAVSDITGFCVEDVKLVIRGSGTTDFIDANLNDVIGVNLVGSSSQQKEAYCHDGFFSINTAGSVGALYSVSVAAGGSGYNVNEELQVSGGYGGVLVINSVGVGGSVTSVSVKQDHAGMNYTTGIKTTSGGGGTGCLVNVTQIQAYTVSANGSNIEFSSSSFPATGTSYYVKYTKYITPVEGSRTLVRVSNAVVKKGASGGVDKLTLLSNPSTTAVVVKTGTSTQPPVGAVRDVAKFLSVNSAANGSGVEYTAVIKNTGVTSISINDAFFDWSRCTTSVSDPGGQPETDTLYYVSFEYYRHDVEGDYLVATSYDDYDNIPFAPNKEWSLRDCFDLRPDGNKPYDGCDVFVDLDYYLPRIDKLCINSTGDFMLLTGKSADVPVAPRDVPGTLTLFVLKVPAYTYGPEDVSLVSVEPTRISQAGIRELVRKVDQLEYAFASSLASLNSTQQATLNTIGMFIDDCVDDVSNTNKAFSRNGITHSMFYDKTNRCYRLPVSDVKLSSLVWDSSASRGFRYTETSDGTIITLDYQEYVFQKQGMATDTININPNPTVNYINGIVDLYPAGDMYFSTQQAAANNVDVDVSIDDIIEKIAPQLVDGVTTWGTWHYAGSNEPSPPPGTIDHVTGRIGNTLYRLDISHDDFVRLRKMGIPYDVTAEIANVAMVNPSYREFIINSWKSLYNPWPYTLTPEEYKRVQNNPLVPVYDWDIVTYQPIYTGEKPVYVFDAATGLFRQVPPIDEVIEKEWNEFAQAKIKFFSMMVGHGWTGQYQNKTSKSIAREGTKDILAKDKKVIELGDRVVDISHVPTMRTKDNAGNPFKIQVKAHSLMPNVAHTCYIGHVYVNLYPSPGYVAGTKYKGTWDTVVTDANGNLEGYFYMPEGIPSGVAEVGIHHYLGQQYSVGRATFTSNGLATTKQSTTIGITTSTVKTTTLSETGVVYDLDVGSTYVDPIGQTFLVTSPTFISGVGVYFATKPTADIPVTCEIHKVSNGYITREVIASVSKRPNEINVSNNGTVETKFVFPNVKLYQPEEYAIVLTTPCQDYNVFIATGGLPDLVSHEPYNAQHAGGVLFKSINNYTWEPVSVSDLKYRLYKANFEPDGDLVFQGITGVEAGLLSARLEQYLIGGASSAWYYQLSPTSPWIHFDPSIDQELEAYPSLVKLKCVVTGSGGTFQIKLDGSGIVLKNHVASSDYISKKIEFGEVLSRPDEVAVTLTALANGFGSSFTSGTSLTPYYSTDDGATWCEIPIDPSFAPKVIEYPFMNYRFVTAHTTGINTISGSNGQPLVVTSEGHRFTNNQLVYVAGNAQVPSDKLCMVSDVTSDTFKLKDAESGSYLLSNGNTVSGGTVELAPFSSLIIRINARTSVLEGTQSTRPRTPLLRKITAICNTTQ
ncbi:MAG: DUF4815 domain-containing protein [bacterium]